MIVGVGQVTRRDSRDPRPSSWPQKQRNLLHGIRVVSSDRSVDHVAMVRISTQRLRAPGAMLARQLKATPYTDLVDQARRPESPNLGQSRGDSNQKRARRISS